MAKISRVGGATRAGQSRADIDAPPVLLRGERLTVLDGAIGFSAPGQTPDLWLSRAADGSLQGAGSSEPWVFSIFDYGADQHNDADALYDTMTAAYAYAAGSDAAFAVVTGAGVTDLGSTATTKGGSTLGNAVMPLPVHAPAGRKVTLFMKGPAPATALVHWQQTTPQRWPWTIRSTLTGQAVDGTWGAPSVIGGPTPQGGYGESTGVFNNLHVVFDGVAVQAPLNPTVCAFDLRGLCEVTVGHAAAIADGTPAQMNGTPPSNNWSTGLLMPQNLNNDLCVIDSFSCEGFYLGSALGEHTAAQRLASIYCHDGVFFDCSGFGNHGYWVGNISVEIATNGIIGGGTADHGPVAINVGMLDTESVTTHIYDPNNALGGILYFCDNNDTVDAPTVNGGANLEIIAARYPRGAATAPAVPANNDTLVNPFYRHADVLITGGTVTQVTIDGATTGLTSGWFPVRSGGSIKITHSSAPTWKWWLK